MKLKVINPYNQELIKEISMDSLEMAEGKIQLAKSCFESDSIPPKVERIRMLKAFQKLCEEKKEQIIELSIREGGKPRKDTMVEFDRALAGVDLCIEALNHLKGEQIPMGQSSAGLNHLAFTKREALGVILAYGAFNHPINLFMHQVIPAVLLGAPIVYKPSDRTPLVALLLRNLLIQVGFAEKMVQILICDNLVAAEIVKSPYIQYFGFIGASAIGWKLRSQLAPGVRCGLEHGGVAPLVLSQGVDYKSWLPLITKAATYHSGQVCISTQHLFVHESQVEEVQTGLIPLFERIEMGDPLDGDTEIGPINNTERLSYVHKLILQAKKSNCKILCGGKMQSPFFQPTLIRTDRENPFLLAEEVFGPVLFIHSYQNIEEVIYQINQLPFAFQTSWIGNDIKEAMNFANQIYAGTVLINEMTVFRTDWMPFAGQKQSGLGSGGYLSTLKEYSYEKLIVMKSPDFE